jgi:hypothetical protein
MIFPDRGQAPHRYRPRRATDPMAEANNNADSSTKETTDIASLQKQLDELTAERDGLRSKLKETSHEARDRRHETKDLSEQLAALQKEREQWQTASKGETESLKAELQKTQGLLRAVKHEQAFARVASKLGVTTPGKLADLYRLAEYKTDGYEPDEGKIEEAFKGVLKDRPWMLDVTKDQAARAAKSAAGADGVAWATQDLRPNQKAGPGADRGQSVSEASSRPARADWPAGRL